MRFDFDEVLPLESFDDAEVRVKFPLGVSIIFVTFTSKSSFSILGTFFLCLIRDIKIIKIITAKIAPLAIAMSSMSPCDLPSIDTFGTV